MRIPQRICIVGGGSIAHVMAGVIGARGDVKVHVLTRRPENWKATIRVLYQNSLELYGQVALVSDDPAAAMLGAEVVFVTVPWVARAETLSSIAQHVAPGAWVGALPAFGGFDWQARTILGDDTPLFGSQRIPFVCNPDTYGESVIVTGVRPQTFVASRPASRVWEISDLLGELLHTRTVPMPNFLSVALMPTNQIMNPARLYALYHDWVPGRRYAARPQFFGDWDERSTEIFGALDSEVQAICRAIPADLGYLKPVVQLYEVARLGDLTAVIRALRSLHGRLVPLRADGTEFVLDVNTSYFTEDIPFGLVVVRSIAEVVGVSTPMMDTILAWAERVTGACYLVDGAVRGPSTTGLPTAGNCGIYSMEQLIANTY